MRRLYSYMIDIANLCMLYCLSITIPFVIFLYTKESFNSSLFYSMGILILISYACNVFVHKLILFIIIHLFLTVLPFLMNLPTITLVFSFLLMVALWIQDIVLWTYRSDKRTLNLPAPFVVINVFIYFYATANDQTTICNLCYYTGLIYIVASILRSYLLNLKRIPANEYDADNTGTSDIIHNNNKYAFTMIGGIFLFSVFSHFPVVERFFGKILSWIVKFFKWLLSLMFHNLDEKEKALITPTPTPTMEPENVNPFPFERGEPSQFAEILEKAFSSIVLTALIIVLALIIYRTLKKIIRNYSTRKKAVYVKDTRGKPIETIEKLKVVKTKKHHHFTLLTSINDKIRQKYAHKINGMQSLGYEIKTSQTPNERSDEIHASLYTDISELTQYYNKARYSDQKLTAKDWQKFKEHI